MAESDIISVHAGWTPKSEGMIDRAQLDRVRPGTLVVSTARMPLFDQQALAEKIRGGSRFYATEWPTWRRQHDEDRLALVRGEKDCTWPRSWEYASWIIEAREKDAPVRIYGNMMNHALGASGGRGEAGKLITNLPGDGCVEVACMADRNGVHSCRFGTLPPQMANICASNMAMFDLGATAYIEKRKDAAIHALMLDPLTAAVCSPTQIKKMTLELFDAEKDFLPGYR